MITDVSEVSILRSDADGADPFEVTAGRIGGLRRVMRGWRLALPMTVPWSGWLPWLELRKGSDAVNETDWLCPSGSGWAMRWGPETGWER